ncbi:MAG: PTS sugar transporter subunit IIC [Elusimicrobia bacterium]|nr:PTS sugar transporter subunit IIC [Elusimicrobiota bacterium]
MSPENALACAAAGAAVVELDASAAGQFMLSRPIVVGPVLGLWLGQPALGAGLGVLCELFTVEELPVGGNLPLNATAAVAVALLLSLGPAPVAPELALPAGLFAGWAHCKLESLLRRRRAALCAAVESRLSAGQEPRLLSLAARELLKQSAATLLLLTAALALRGPLLSLWFAAPAFLRTGLKFSLSASPWLVLWSLLRSFKVVS